MPRRYWIALAALFFPIRPDLLLGAPTLEPQLCPSPASLCRSSDRSSGYLSPRQPKVKRKERRCDKPNRLAWNNENEYRGEHTVCDARRGSHSCPGILFRFAAASSSWRLATRPKLQEEKTTGPYHGTNTRKSDKPVFQSGGRRAHN